MSPAAAPPLLLRQRSRQLVAVALLLALLLSALAAAFVAFEWAKIEATQKARAELYARALEDQTASAVSRTDTILHSLAQALAQPQRPEQRTEVASRLQDSLRDRPFLRSVSWLDGQGRVRASSNPDNIGLTVPLALLGPVPEPGRAARLAPLAAGRDLGSLGQVPLAQARVLALPLVLSFNTPQGPGLLVALINPDHFATQFERALDGSPLRALLAGLDGRLIVGTTAVDAATGSSMTALPAFSRHLPAREFASDVGPGSDGRRVLSAFRTARGWPLVVVVEQPQAVFQNELIAIVEWTTAFLFTAWALLAAGTWTLRRTLRSDEQLAGELAEAHAATQASESRKLAILQSSLDAIVTVGADGRVLEFNAAAERMFGHAAAQAIGQPMHEMIVPSHHRPAHQAGMARYQATGVTHVLNRRIEVEALRADGSLFPVELTIVPVATADGQIFTATLRDITERLRVETALRDSQSLLDKTGRIGGIGGWTLELGETLPRWTDQTAVIHDQPPGYQPQTLEEAIGYYAPAAADRMAQAVQQAIASGEGFDIELPLITAKRRHIWVRLVGKAEYEGGRAVRLVGAIQDITERRRAQDDLAAARERELLIGARIQQALLVDAPDQRLPGLWLSTLNQASQGIDGDFVELISLGDRGVDIIVGDVMGKGVAAALMAAGTKMQFSRCVASLFAEPEREGALPSPAEVVAAVHEAMTANLQALEAFVTLSYLRLDMLAGTITWVGCGHEEPLLLRPGGQMQSLGNQHPPLGVLYASDYRQDVVPFTEGDALFLCSDGAADALMPDGSRLGRERVIALLSALMARVQTPAAVLHALRRDLVATGARITDDLTLALAIASGPTPRASRRELPADLVNLKHVRGIIEHRCREAGLAEVETSLFAVACVEAYTNAMRHTRGRPAGAPVEMVVRVEPEAVVVDIVTLGEPFVPPARAAETNFETFPEGGFGIHIMQQSTDALDYLHEKGVNTVRLIRLRRHDAG
jgi:PAS domain S-box-containing protein